MTVQELLSELQKQGVSLTSLPGGRLEVRPASKLTAELRAELKRCKGEILTVLNAPRRVRPEYLTLWERLAAIIAQDLWAVDCLWLADTHPALWQRLRGVDDDLVALQSSGNESEYFF